MEVIMMMDPDYEYCNLESWKEINGGFLDFPISDLFTADRSYWRAFALSKEGGEIAKSSIWTTHSFDFHFNHQMEEKKYLKKEQAAYKELYSKLLDDGWEDDDYGSEGRCLRMKRKKVSIENK
jgi:hypothetical protein